MHEDLGVQTLPGLFSLPPLLVGIYLLSPEIAGLGPIFYGPALAVTLIVVARIPLARRLAAAPPTDPYDPVIIAYVGLTMATAAAWGLMAAIIFLEAGDSEPTYVFVIATFGIAAGAVATLSITERIIVPYVVLLLAPQLLATAYLAAQGRCPPIVPVMILVFAGFVLMTSARFCRVYQARLAIICNSESAMSATEAKSRFLAAVSHEIRTPLNGILGVTDLMKETRLDEEQSELLATIDDASKSLLRIINDVLDLAKVDAGRLDLVEATFSPVANVEELVGIMEPVARAKQLELSVWFAHDLPEEVVGDAGRIQQILLNLVGNAVKFTRVGGVHIQVRRCPGRPGLRFSVTDTGPGLEPGFKPFEAFSQGSAGGQHGGTGLGLAICERLTRLMNGEIGFEQPERGGTTFWLEVPVTPRTPRQVPPPNARRAWVIDPWGPGRSGTIQTLRRFGVDAEAIVPGSGPPPPNTDAWVAVDEVNGEMKDILTRLKAPDSRIIIMTARERRAYLLQELAYLVDDVTTRPLTHAGVERVLYPGKPRLPVGAARPLDSVSALSKRILIVEDNRINQMLAERLVRAAGFDSEIAPTGREAVTMVANGEWDAILMDCRMPEMDGWQAAREIRRLESNSRPRVPIIAMTADAPDRIREQCLEAGMDRYLCKPIDPVELAALLREVTNT